MTKRILVIDDTMSHIDDARKFSATLSDVVVDFASDYEGAVGKGMYIKGRDEKGLCFTKGNYDGIITDLFFPYATQRPWNHADDPLGLRVALEAKSAGVPCVINTALYHHGSRVQWIYGMLSLPALRGVRFVDSGTDYTTPADGKNWPDAFRAIEIMTK